MRSRNFIFTWNNYPDDYSTVLDTLDVRYIVAGEETAPTTGTPHLQGFLVFRNARALDSVRRTLHGCHVEVARGSARQNYAYCTKTRPEDESPNPNVYSRGDIPMDAADKGDAERARWASTLSAAKEGRFDDIPADMLIRNYSSLRRIERDYMPKLSLLESPCGVWIHGDAGSGKSLSVLRAYPDLFPKPRNQWWDGYQEEPVICIDDIDRFDVRLGGHLKIWADAYPFIGEVKGGSRKLRPRLVVVTSQYKIEEIWSDQATQDALNRRFKKIEKILGQNIILSY